MIACTHCEIHAGSNADERNCARRRGRGELCRCGRVLVSEVENLMLAGSNVLKIAALPSSPSENGWNWHDLKFVYYAHANMGEELTWN